MESAETLRDAVIYFSEFEHCREFMIAMRWADGVVKCPRCGNVKVYWLDRARVWKCSQKHERPTFTLKTGTIFEDSPIPLEKWLCAAWLIIGCKNGVSSYEIHRGLGVTQKTAWFMLHRLRLAMKESGFEVLSGEVEADETFVGGKLGLMNKQTKARKILREGRLAGGGTVGKAIVMGLLERHGRAHVKVIEERRRHNLIPEVRKHVQAGSTVYTDQLLSYRDLLVDYAHEVIDHTEAYVKGRIHTNGMENFWSLFKRALKGTYVSVEPFHLQAYADEQCFRFNQRKLTDAQRFVIVMKQIVGLRITYKELTGKTELQAEARP